ncbi:hexameric tyrosine-coordinated heme protein [Halomonas mongoliensis]|uniref:hexameric tyrosine-coordinated heme protein n=1 Tax=Halomonas mongoliensis TaxID=321265 RepID=UPI00403AD8D6
MPSVVELDGGDFSASFEEVSALHLLLGAGEEAIMTVIHPPSSSRLKVAVGLMLATLLALGSIAGADEHEASSTEDTWLPSLITATPQEGFALAITLSQKGVAATQKDAEIRRQKRAEYHDVPDSLIAASHVIATHFQTVAAANDYWRE